MCVEFCQDIISMQEAEQLVSRPIVQLLPFVGVNVVHHQVNLRLLELVK